MTMEELRALFESLGYQDVETYFQSGNVVFAAAESNERALRESIHNAIEAEFDYDITVMIRTRAELEAIVSEQPFDVSGTEGVKHYITFLNENPTNEQVESLLETQSDAERFTVSGREVYSELNKDELGSGRYTDVGRKLGLEATRRNLDVVNAVRDIASS